MDISMDIYGKSVDMDMDGKFHIHGKPESNSAYMSVTYYLKADHLTQVMKQSTTSTMR